MVAACIAIGATVVLLRSPSLDREWAEDVRVLSSVDIAGSGAITLGQVRNWSYSEEAVVSQEYLELTYNPDEIESVWMYEQLLDPRELIAHTFLVFQFSESYGNARYLGLSVETRRELGEEYSIIGGALRSFEITHIWALEDDLVRRRVQYLDYPLTRYKLDISTEYAAGLFAQFARETAALAVTPEWYNTLTNNCTSSLVRYANNAKPGAIPIHYSTVLTGRIDDYLKRLSYLDPEYALHITREYLESNGLR